jgi:hypothetical protein
MITEKQQRKIDEIMDEFNFGKVAKVMKYLKWSWCLTGVPCEAEIRKSARKRLQELVLKNNSKPNKQGDWQQSVFSGGLFAKHFGGTDEKGPWENMELRFVLEHFTTEENE